MICYQTNSCVKTFHFQRGYKATITNKVVQYLPWSVLHIAGGFFHFGSEFHLLSMITCIF